MTPRWEDSIIATMQAADDDPNVSFEDYVRGMVRVARLCLDRAGNAAINGGFSGRLVGALDAAFVVVKSIEKETLR